jgi:hypothetical protein
MSVRSIFWLGYNIGYLHFSAGRKKASEIVNEFTYFLSNLSELGLGESDIARAAVSFKEEISKLDPDSTLSREQGNRLADVSYEWRDKLAEMVKDKHAFWAGYNLISIQSQARFASCRDLAQELSYLRMNLYGCDLLDGQVEREISEWHQKLSPRGHGERPMQDEISALKGKCEEWRKRLTEKIKQ